MTPKPQSANKPAPCPTACSVGSLQCDSEAPPHWLINSVHSDSRVYQQPDTNYFTTSLRLCSFDALPPMFAKKWQRSFIWRKPALPKKSPGRAQLAAICRKTSIRVVKTIRPRLSMVLPLLQVRLEEAPAWLCAGRRAARLIVPRPHEDVWNCVFSESNAHEAIV